jgi:hypothetical protein
MFGQMTAFFHDLPPNRPERAMGRPAAEKFKAFQSVSK